MTVLDRYLLRSLLVNYGIGLGVMLSLYVVLDMFVNLDEFVESDPGFFTLVANVVDYYVPNLFLYFAQLSGVITLFACAAVLARMRKMNELTAVLSSGISLYRVARPILAFALLATLLLTIDTELLIPAVAHKLAREHEDTAGERAYEVMFLRDRGGALLSAGKFDPRTNDLERMLVLTRDDRGVVTQTLEADRAVWIPPGETRLHGAWALQRGRLISRKAADPSAIGPRERQEVAYPTEYESDLDPKTIQMRQASGWVRFLSLSQLDELQQAGTTDAAAIIQTRHTRIVAPLVSFLLVLLGLPFFLDRSPANILNDAGKCMLVCGLCYMVAFMAQGIRLETQSPIPAWLPIFVFGPAAIVLLDRVRT
jgi:lipopolysaccharide export LptBFGC system permease protein LptF